MLRAGGMTLLVQVPIVLAMNKIDLVDMHERSLFSKRFNPLVKDFKVLLLSFVFFFFPNRFWFRLPSALSARPRCRFMYQRSFTVHRRL